MQNSKLIYKACQLAAKKVKEINNVDNEEDLMYFNQKEGMLFYKTPYQQKFDTLYDFYYERLKKEEVVNE